MRPNTEASSSVPAFLVKLWHLVNDEMTNELICWDGGGMSFHVMDQSRFASEILPLYFKHRNIASFIRQLNMYGFRKVVHVEPVNISIKEQDDVEFSHQYFIQGQENLLEFIKRKVPHTTTTTVSTRKSAVSEPLRKEEEEEEELDKVAADVSGIKSSQDGMSSQLNSLKIQNDLLWQEVAKLRKENKHHGIVMQKLVHLLVGIGVISKQALNNVGSLNHITNVGSLNLKRKMPLMIEGAPGTSESSQSPAKVRRGNSTDYQVDLVDYLVKCSESRPSIQELTDNGDDVTPISADNTEIASSFVDASSSSIYNNVQYSEQQSPLEPLSLSDVDDNSQLTNQELNNLLESGAVNDALLCDQSMSPAMSPLMSTGYGHAAVKQEGDSMNPSSSDTLYPSFSSDVTTVALSDPLFSSGFDSADLSSQIDVLQSNIHNIREMFACGQYNFDTTSLFGLYDLGLPGVNTDEDDSQDGETFKDGQKLKTELTKNIVGNEVMQYVPQDNDYKDLFQEILSPSYRPLDTPIYEPSDIFDSDLPQVID